jgi:hypothetical protein
MIDTLMVSTALDHVAADSRNDSGGARDAFNTPTRRLEARCGDMPFRHRRTKD